MRQLESAETHSRSLTTFARNSFLNVGRLFVSTIVALLLPAVLTKRLPVETYSAWVLILQMSSYVSYLDFGIQSGISKYVAEYESKGDRIGSSLRASAGFVLMFGAGSMGVLLSLILAVCVPRLFVGMPSNLYRDARISLICVGTSLSIGLICSVFSAIFTGQQRFAIPISLQVINRLLYAAAVLVAVCLHRGLVFMGGLVAVVNITTGVLQVEAWRHYCDEVRITLRSLDITVLKEMLSYCATLAVWSAGMLCVSGLDVTIVGHYDFTQTAFYSIATLSTTFTVSFMGAALAPLIPTVSSLSVTTSPTHMGAVLSRVTRYSSVLMVCSGIPLLVSGYWILHIWVGDNYAVQTLPYLRILILGNMIRGFCAPYASMLVATNTQKVAIAGALLEALVNLSSSILLARHIGAIGVAYGTLIGAIVSVTVHFLFNMRRT